MIPAAFDYIRAESADHALAELQRLGGEARVLAGGQSLIPAMRFRLARPAVLIDINALTDLEYIRIDDGSLTIGAIARDQAVERAPWIADRKWALLRDAARVVADPVVRQMGTVVGSLLDMKARWDYGLWLETADKAFRFHVGGRMQPQVVWVKADDRVRFGPNGIGRLDDAVNFRRARLAVELAGLPYRVLDEQVEIASGYLSICTMHLAKGLEFRVVVVMACDDEVIPLQARIEAVADEADLEEVYNTERHLLYVACTRARDHLLVTSVAPASEFLDDLRL